MTNPGFQTQPPRSSRLRWLFAAVVAGGTALALSQCGKEAPAPVTPAAEPTPIPVHESVFSSIYVVFNKRGEFFGAADYDPRRANENATARCISTRNAENPCYGVQLLAYGIGNLTGVRPTKTCAAIGVDYLKVLTGAAQYTEQGTDYVIVQAPTSQAAYDQIKAACATRPGQCKLGTHVQCNY